MEEQSGIALYRLAVESWGESNFLETVAHLQARLRALCALHNRNRMPQISATRAP